VVGEQFTEQNLGVVLDGKNVIFMTCEHKIWGYKYARKGTCLGE